MSEQDGSGPAAVQRLEGLVVDWGGVLTAPLDGAITGWASADGIDYEHFRTVMRRWVGARRSGSGPGEGLAGDPPADRDTAADGFAVAEAAPDDGPAFSSPVHRLERGELATEEFEQLLADELAALGSTVPARGLLRRMLSGLDELDARMLDLLRRARAAGLRTALLSNSWGNTYPEEVWDGLFDAVVISGRVGMRKPEARIYRHAAELLGLDPARCVMVDDLPHNVTGAAAAGMVGVQHRSYDETVAELETLFSVPLR
jgi:epoxide hydrolase-like predicted phosphatase